MDKQPRERQSCWVKAGAAQPMHGSGLCCVSSQDFEPAFDQGRTGILPQRWSYALSVVHIQEEWNAKNWLPP